MKILIIMLLLVTFCTLNRNVFNVVFQRIKIVIFWLLLYWRWKQKVVWKFCFWVLLNLWPWVYFLGASFWKSFQWLVIVLHVTFMCNVAAVLIAMYAWTVQFWCILFHGWKFISTIAHALVLLCFAVVQPLDCHCSIVPRYSVCRLLEI